MRERINTDRLDRGREPRGRQPWMPTLTVKGAERHRELNDDGLVLALIMHASG